MLKFLPIFFFAFTIPSALGVGILTGLSQNIIDNPPIPTTISSVGPDIAGASKYVYLTGASYCFDLSNWNCTYCLKAKANGQELVAIASNTTYNTLAIITKNTAASELVVTFRGTYNLPNVLVDLVFVKVDDSDDSSVMVMSGFLAATQSLYPQVVSQLETLLLENPGYKVVFAGHSLGAAMASLTLYQIQNRFGLTPTFPLGISYSFYGFGEPRVGNRAYADFWNSQNIPVTRIVNKGDVIPHGYVYFGVMGYMHHGNELWIEPTTGVNKSCSKTLYEDPACSNSQGPFYNPMDHCFYWDVNYLLCAAQNPIALLKQFAI